MKKTLLLAALCASVTTVCAQEPETAYLERATVQIHTPEMNARYGSRAATECVIHIRLKHKENNFGVWTDVKKSSIF